MFKRLLAFAMVIAICISFTACKKKENTPENQSEAEVTSSESNEKNVKSSESDIEINSMPDWKTKDGVVLSNLTYVVKDYIKNKNSDTKAWLNIVGDDFSQPVVQYKGDQNEYYYRRNIEKRNSQLGVLYFDFRNELDKGANGLSRNTVIYGHNLNDDPNGQMFAKLKSYTEARYADEHRILQLTLTEELTAWEICAAYYTSAEIAYNNPDLDDKMFESIIQEAKSNSVFNFNVNVDKTDKILILSTCTYVAPNEKGEIVEVEYPSNHRFVVLAKLREIIDGQE